MSKERLASAGSPILTWFSALSDPARLRILRLLDGHELSVGELAKALQLPQSTVSRHLKVLHEGGWIVKWTQGTTSRYHLDRNTLAEPACRLWELTRDQLGHNPTHAEDDRRVAGVLAERRADSRSFFGALGGEWDHVRQELFGQTFTPEALLGLLPANWIVADLGCGTGNIAEILAPFVRQVIAVDRESAMLDAARKRLDRVDNVEFRPGDLTALPLDDGSVNATVTSLVLHHLPDPTPAVREMARVVRPGGKILIVDMVAHDRETYRHTMGHQHLGFSESQVRHWADAADAEFRRYTPLRPDPHGKGPGLFAATLRRPA